jgi:hypothetical protein
MRGHKKNDAILVRGHKNDAILVRGHKKRCNLCASQKRCNLVRVT